MKLSAIFKQCFPTFLLVLAAATAPAQAQELSEKLEKFKQNCLNERNYAKAGDLDGLNSCAKAFRKMEIRTLSNDALQPHEDDTMERAGHLQFSAEYVDTLIICNLERMQIKGDLHTAFRGGWEPIGISHQGIPAHSRRTFTFEGYDHQEFLVIAEDESDIRIEVLHPASDTHYVSGEAKDGVQIFSWYMGEEPSACTLTIENPTDRDVLCVVASN